MSSRWYPRFVKGNPQLRIFLPDFWMILKKPPQPLPENVVMFKVPIVMTTNDVRNYLEKIYKIPVMDIRTKAKCGEIKRAPGKVYLIKGEDYRDAYITLPEGMKFEFPNLFPTEKVEEQTKDFRTLKENIEKEKVKLHRRTHDRDNVPSWFSF